MAVNEPLPRIVEVANTVGERKLLRTEQGEEPCESAC